MKRIISIVIILSTVLFSCKPKLFDPQLRVYGYVLGDSIKGNFKLIESFDETCGLFGLKIDKRFNVFTIKNHIYIICLSKLTYAEYKGIEKNLTGNLKIKPIHNYRTTNSGLTITGEEINWFDKNSLTEYLVEVNQGNDSIYSLFISNELITDSIGRIYIQDYGKETKIEITKIYSPD